MKNDLTTLQRAKDWLNVETTNSDVLLSRLVTSASALVLNWLNRSIAQDAYSEKYNGTGHDTMKLNSWPIVSISMVSINGTQIQASPDGISFGYVNDDKFLYILGGRFEKGIQNISVVYTAGYGNSDTLNIPATPYQILSTSLTKVWSSDCGVVMGGVPMVQVAATPTTGQYSVDGNGNYTFAAADTGKPVVITYGTVPYDIEQGCIELVGHKFRERNRIGLQTESISLTGQTTTYSLADMSDTTKQMLQSYRKVIP